MPYELLGRTLFGRTSEITIGNITWEKALELGENNEWEPSGVLNKNDPDFDPFDYFSPVGQYVSTKDSKALGVALERALDDIPNEESGGNKSIGEMNPWEFFSGSENKRELKQLVGFLKRSGGFKIF